MKTTYFDRKMKIFMHYKDGKPPKGVDEGEMVIDNMFSTVEFLKEPVVEKKEYPCKIEDSDTVDFGSCDIFIRNGTEYFVECQEGKEPLLFVNDLDTEDTYVRYPVEDKVKFIFYADVSKPVITGMYGISLKDFVDHILSDGLEGWSKFLEWVRNIQETSKELNLNNKGDNN